MGEPDVYASGQALLLSAAIQQCFVTEPALKRAVSAHPGNDPFRNLSVQ